MPYPQHTCGVAEIDFLQAGKGEIRIAEATHAISLKYGVNKTDRDRFALISFYIKPLSIQPYTV